MLFTSLHSEAHRDTVNNRVSAGCPPQFGYPQTKNPMEHVQKTMVQNRIQMMGVSPFFSAKCKHTVATSIKWADRESGAWGHNIFYEVWQI